jgi:hypothetical protein
MMCEKVYQSERCCELPALKTTPSHPFTYPHSQIAGWPKMNNTSACATIIIPATPYGRIDVFSTLLFYVDFT